MHNLLEINLTVKIQTEVAIQYEHDKTVMFHIFNFRKYTTANNCKDQQLHHLFKLKCFELYIKHVWLQVTYSYHTTSYNKHFASAYGCIKQELNWTVLMEEKPKIEFSSFLL